MGRGLRRAASPHSVPPEQMSTQSLTPSQLAHAEGADPAQPPASRPRRRRRRSSGSRLAYWLIGPALGFMVLVHGIPSLAGIALSFLNLNTFTFSQLFGAPWNGLENYRSILFESSNPLHNGFTQAVGHTAFYTAFTVGGTLMAGLGIALLLNRQFRGRRMVRALMLTPWVVPS